MWPASHTKPPSEVPGEHVIRAGTLDRFGRKLHVLKRGHWIASIDDESGNEILVVSLPGVKYFSQSMSRCLQWKPETVIQSFEKLRISHCQWHQANILDAFNTAVTHIVVLFILLTSKTYKVSIQKIRCFGAILTYMYTQLNPYINLTQLQNISHLYQHF